MVGWHRLSGDGDIGPRAEVLLKHWPEIHTVELVARKDENQVVIFETVVMHILTNGIGGTLVPSFFVACLFGGEDVDKATTEGIKLIGLLDVLME